MDRGREPVHAGQREIRGRIHGLLDEAHDMTRLIHLRDSEPLRIRDGAQQDLRGRWAVITIERRLVRAAPFRFETINEARDTLLNHVVAEIHDEVVVAEEVAADEDAVAEAEWSVLLDVRDLYAPTVA